MTLIVMDQHKMTHWLPPQVQYGRFACPTDMVARALESLPCFCGDNWGQNCRCHVLRGVRVNDIDPMAPWGNFRKLVLKSARTFVQNKRKESLEFHAVTQEADMLVYGPYHHQVVVGLTRIAPVRGRKREENLHPDFLDFKIWCEFTQTYARATDLGPGRPQWALDYWANVDTEMEQEARRRKEESSRDIFLVG